MWNERSGVPVLLDAATALALGGDCAADVALARGQPEAFGEVASIPTVWRLIAALTEDADAAVAGACGWRVPMPPGRWGTATRRSRIDDGSADVLR